MHRRSYRKFQHSCRDFQEKINMRPFPKRLLQAKEDATGRKVFGERFMFAAVGEQGYAQVQRVTNCAPSRAPVAGSRKGTEGSLHAR